MTLISTHVDRDDLGGGRFRDSIAMRAVGYWSGGSLQTIASDWQNGDQDWPHVVTAAPFLTYTAQDGKRRFCPTQDPDRYFEIGAPYLKIAGVWQKVSLGTATRRANRITWNTTNANVYIDHGGHFIKLAILLKNGWCPPDGLIAFPIGINGLTRSGKTLLADGVPVMALRNPHVEDYNNPYDVRPIAHAFVQESGQWYVLFTLPDLAGMSQPLIDPTFGPVQPNAADGLDAIISESATTTNYGTLDNFGVGNATVGSGNRRTLIKFNLDALPAIATLKTVKLSLCVRTDDSANARTFRVYRTKRAWVEAQATWNIYSTGNNWSTAGGFHANDCEQTDIGSADFSASETPYAFKDFSLTPTTKTALDLGNGWLIKADTEADDLYYFFSSDWSTDAERPKLTITYQLPAVRRALLGVGQ